MEESGLSLLPPFGSTKKKEYHHLSSDRPSLPSDSLERVFAIPPRTPLQRLIENEYELVYETEKEEIMRKTDGEGGVVSSRALREASLLPSTRKSKRQRTSPQFFQDGHRIAHDTEDFYAVVRFVSIRGVQVRIVRTDSPIQTWTQNLRLKIHKLETTDAERDGDKAHERDGDFEILFIGSRTEEEADPSRLPYFEKEFILQRVDVRSAASAYPSVIPKWIMQTDHTRRGDDRRTAENLSVYDSVQSLLDLNPEMHYFFFDESAILEWMSVRGPEWIRPFLLLRPGAFRADFFRYCFLYVHGGCYFDHKLFLKRPLRSYLASSVVARGDEGAPPVILLCSDWTGDYRRIDRIYNAILFCSPRSRVLLDAIQRCTHNIEHHLYNNGLFDITGPQLLVRSYYAFPRECRVLFRHDGYYPLDNLKNCIVTERMDDGNHGRLLVNKPYFYCNVPREEHYPNMYNSRRVFFTKIVEVVPFFHILIDLFGSTDSDASLTVRKHRQRRPRNSQEEGEEEEILVHVSSSSNITTIPAVLHDARTAFHPPQRTSIDLPCSQWISVLVLPII